MPHGKNSIHKDQTLDILVKSMVRLKMSILQIWVSWASKITFKNLPLCSIKIKGSHAPMTSHTTALWFGIESREPAILFFISGGRDERERTPEIKKYNWLARLAYCIVSTFLTVGS